MGMHSMQTDMRRSGVDVLITRPILSAVRRHAMPCHAMMPACLFTVSTKNILFDLVEYNACETNRWVVCGSPFM